MHAEWSDFKADWLHAFIKGGCLIAIWLNSQISKYFSLLMEESRSLRIHALYCMYMHASIITWVQMEYETSEQHNPLLNTWDLTWAWPHYLKICYMWVLWCNACVKPKWQSFSVRHYIWIRQRCVCNLTHDHQWASSLLQPAACIHIPIWTCICKWTSIKEMHARNLKIHAHVRTTWHPQWKTAWQMRNCAQSFAKKVPFQLQLIAVQYRNWREQFALLIVWLMLAYLIQSENSGPSSDCLFTCTHNYTCYMLEHWESMHVAIPRKLVLWRSSVHPSYIYKAYFLNLVILCYAELMQWVTLKLIHMQKLHWRTGYILGAFWG